MPLTCCTWELNPPLLGRLASEQDALGKTEYYAYDPVGNLIARTDGEATQIGNEFIRFCLGPQVLGDVYPTIPDESLLVSDLVPVDHKVRLCAKILPKVVDDLAAGGARQDVADEIDRELRSFGEDPRGLVRDAAAAWFGDKDVVSRLDASALAFARGLFE